ncbi:MAG: hypothetical protein WC623_18285 [Pedobacter sp.]|uniref:hypothetical protein n=1 Tax=Pedobacter sp. TaxID=1411316 RepID=UPI0035631FBE
MNRLFCIGLWCLFILTFSISSCKKKKEIEEIKFYKVGDRYEVGAETGIIYKVVTLSGSMFAMAVSLDEADLAWSTEYVETNIKDLKNGLNNQKAIQALPGWESKYPAFKWCADKNKNGTGGWYFPSPTEMQELFAVRIEENGSNISLSEYLKKVGGIGFAESDDRGWSPYWASSELFGGTSANSATFTESNGVSYDKKTIHKVRAIKYIQIYK